MQGHTHREHGHMASNQYWSGLASTYLPLCCIPHSAPFQFRNTSQFDKYIQVKQMDGTCCNEWHSEVTAKAYASWYQVITRGSCVHRWLINRNYTLRLHFVICCPSLAGLASVIITGIIKSSHWACKIIQPFQSRMESPSHPQSRVQTLLAGQNQRRSTGGLWESAVKIGQRKHQVTYAQQMAADICWLAVISRWSVPLHVKLSRHADNS